PWAARGALRSPAGRRAPAAPADLALRLLLRHSDWWERLSAEDHGLLHGLDGLHGRVIAWLERLLTDQGPLTWAALDTALPDEPWAAQARQWVTAADPDEAQDYADLQRVVRMLWVDRLQVQAQQLAATAPTLRDELERLRSVNEQIRRLKAELAAGAS
ncbi:MAG: DNA primase, partial [Burkholderiales bacterium]|nr:DNA primase [Burkholderiales bacterium]